MTEATSTQTHITLRSCPSVYVEIINDARSSFFTVKLTHVTTVSQQSHSFSPPTELVCDWYPTGVARIKHVLAGKGF